MAEGQGGAAMFIGWGPGGEGGFCSSPPPGEGGPADGSKEVVSGWDLGHQVDSETPAET